MLNLKTCSEFMTIKMLGSEEECQRSCDVVEVRLLTHVGDPVILHVAVVPHMCDPVCIQPIAIAASASLYEHLSDCSWPIQEVTLVTRRLTSLLGQTTTGRW